MADPCGVMGRRSGGSMWGDGEEKWRVHVGVMGGRSGGSMWGDGGDLPTPRELNRDFQMIC